MPFNISEFASRGLVYGGARPSLFDVVLDTPISLPGTDPLFSDRLRFTCKATSMPGATVDDVQVPYFGRKIKLAGDRTFDDWSVSVLNDEDFTVRDTFELWSNALNTLVGNLKQINANDYKVSGYVNQYGKTGNVIKTYQIFGLWPKNIAPMSVDWDAVNRIQEFQVNFAYDYWIPVSVQNNGIIVDPGNISSGEITR